MLTRAVRRRRNLQLGQYAVERLQLPWLCPALWSSHTTYTNSRQNHRPVTRRSALDRSATIARLSTNAQKQAAATPVPSLLGARDAYSPVEFSKRPSLLPTSSALLPDLSNILLLEHTTAVGPLFNDGRTSRSQLRGDAWEIEATLDACLQINQWDRSMTILSQLRGLYIDDVEQSQRLCNKVLEAMVFDHIWNGSSVNIAKINSWVEGTLQKMEVPPNAHTFALKIKAAMATLQGRKRDRTVKRYWDMAKEYNVDWEVASLRAILSDSDLGKLSEISPLKFEPEGEDIESEDTLSVPEGVVSQPNLASVRETDQKGLGLLSLRRSLSLFNDATRLAEWENDHGADLETRTEYARRRQMQLEQDSLASAADRWKIEHDKMMKIGVMGDLSHGKIGALMWTWQEKLTKAIEAELAEVTTAEAGSATGDAVRRRKEYGPFLRLLEPQHLAVLTITSMISIMSKVGVEAPVKLVRLVTGVGSTIEMEVAAKQKQEREAFKAATKQVDRVLGAHGVPTQSPTTQPRMHWSIAQHAQVGAILCDLIFTVAKVQMPNPLETELTRFISQPAFERKNVYTNGKRIGVVSLHLEMVKMLTKEPVADVLAKQLPMICEPKPWTGFKDGGYLDSQNAVLRIKNVDAAQKEYTKAAAERGDLDQLFKGLDVLGQTGWRVNQNVFRVMLDAWNSGEAVANLPPVSKFFPQIQEPGATASPREKYEYYKSVQSVKNEQGGLHSNRCFQNFQMEIARAYLNETFYLPHNVDFRGRAYPIPPYLNQMGADNARGLLKFATGKPLGAAGLRWLKIHLANVCGYDKASLTDRALYADQHMEDIRDSVRDPLGGRKWWLTAEDAWQCLAACFELTNALDSGDAESYVSHLPIHQDGTCNGLQHYAALGGDVAGARQVNLEPGDKPADVYTGVAELVKAEVKIDAASGHSLAKELDGRITRKIVKQTVMTNVYGVTFMGAQQQVRKQLDDLLPDLKEKKLAGPASLYIARKIFKGLGTLFNGAHEIQYWFGDCASRITNSISLAQLEEIANSSPGLRTGKKQKQKLKSRREESMSERGSVESEDFRSTIVWTTPLKLPVVQPYRISHSQSISTCMSKIALMDPHVTDCVDRRKQLQGFPPNFVHSLDATHMMLSAVEANKNGLTFSAVHDSFWTHAADIDKLNLLLRDAFIRMHTEDIVGRLAEEFKLRYKGHVYMAKLKGQSGVAQKIREWRMSNAKNGHDTTSAKKGKRGAADKRRQFWELNLEYKRQKLLASSDAAEVARGQAMVTPASIFEANDGERHLKVQNSLGETALGKIPDNQQKPGRGVLKEALKHEEVSELHDIDMKATLEPAIQAQAEAEAEAEAEANMETALEADEELSGEPETKSKRGGANAGSGTWLWLPLTFKPVPKKGDWDVRRLKDSVYFFS